MALTEKFSEFLKIHRENQGFTQEELAEKLFVSSKAVSKWEKGNAIPEITRFRDIAAVLDVSELELFNILICSDNENTYAEIPYGYKSEPLKRENFLNDEIYRGIKSFEDFLTDEEHCYTCKILLTESEYRLYKYLHSINPDYSVNEFLNQFVLQKVNL